MQIATAASHMSSGRTQLRRGPRRAATRASSRSFSCSRTPVPGYDSARGLHQPSSASDLMLPPTVLM